MGAPDREITAIFQYVNRVRDFYAKEQALKLEAEYLDRRYGEIVSGYDGNISVSTWLNTYQASDLAVISGDIIGVKEYLPTISGWRAIYVEV